ncbi:uncharacterized protein CCOS01_16105 [Colletotrichum costaricense]|uniref:Nephrocystin 3-like N-terminal domain-containing protein n=1 Tax=Colletotrichum costaricense TaxID=1209916 RepID=A0AAI9YGI6_9PEZI|nr:uncharacterized protein CCOS01_16105 [Colletotrichum costaricense]KAK1508104.1 hypothetical protein CCOS01_16105 [Colletotrichum costaricense]
MTDSRQSDGGCLSAICSCFKRREKPRHDVSGSPSTGVDVLPASKSADDGKSEPTDPKVVRRDPVLSVSRATSSTGNADGPSLLPASNVPGPSALNGSTSTVNLWQEACKKVNVKTQIWIASLPPPSNVQNPASELAEFVRASEEKHKQESLKLKSGDREILWRDYANKVIPVVTAIGNIAINFAPAPSNAVWSAIKVLLAAHVSEREDLVAIMGCTDIVLCLVRRGRVYEKVYIGNSMSPRPPYQEDLMTKLVEVYAKCLEFLAFVYEEMEHGHLRRFFDALVDPGYGENRLSAVRALEQELELATRPCKATADDEHRRLLENLEEPIKRTDKNVMDILKVLDKHERDKAMEYVSVIPVGSHHNEKVEKRTKGTCEWLVSHSKFLEWEDSDCTPVFWLRGDIGTGKSFLSSKVVDHCRIHDKLQFHSGHSLGLAFFYCNSSDQSRQSIQSILRSYIRQLGEVNGHPESIHETLFNLYQRKQIQSDITLQECETALVEMINSYPRTVLILDALDECKKDTRRQIVQLFKRLVEKTNSCLKIFIASRPEHDISDHLRSFQELRATIIINTSDNQGDIEKFVHTEVDNFTVDWSPETKQVVKEKLVKKSKGMFRWTYLQWEQLKEFETNTTVKARLGDLPKTLTKAYDEICDKHEPESFERFMLQRAVRWVMCARRPFDSRTLLSAIQVESEQMHGDGMKAHDKSDLTEKMLETVCQHLIVRDPKLEVWRFSHASVREYFEDKKKERWVKDAPAEVAIVLINCLRDCCAAYSSIWPPSDVDDDDDDSRTLQEGCGTHSDSWYEAGGADLDQPLDPRHPLQAYIRLNWLTHTHDLPEQDDRAEDVALALKQFLGEERPPCSSKEYQVFCSRAIEPAQWLFYTPMSKQVRPVTNFAFGIVAMGLHRFLPEWWNEGLDLPSLVNEEGLGLLQIATHFGHYDLCQFLISRGCDVNASFDALDYGPPLWISVNRREIDVMELLLKNGANMDCVLKDQTLACLAAENGSGCCTILLENGLDPNMKCNTDDTGGSGGCRFGCALSRAAFNGDLNTIKALLDKGAEVNPENLKDSYGSPLTSAIFHGRLESARFLLENGANVNDQFRYGNFGCPLIAAIRVGEPECVRLLLEREADVNAMPEGGEYGSPLAAAVSMADVDFARSLIQHGADAKAELRFGKYGSPLAAAVWRGDVNCARLLIEHGAEVNAYLEFGEYGSILSAAIFGWSSSESSLVMIKFLVEEAKADLAQLAFVRPRRKEDIIWETRRERYGSIDGAMRQRTRYRKRRREMDMTAYLVQELQIERQVLISLGIPRRDLPPDIDATADIEYEETDMFDWLFESDWKSGSRSFGFWLR